VADPVLETTVIEEDPSVRHKAFFGLILCAVYAVVYAGFVVISVYDVTLMDTVMPLGLNLGVFYGLGLILLAFVLGMVYTHLWGAWEKASRASSGKVSDPAAKAKSSGVDC